MSLKTTLRRRPIIYEIVPPRRDTSRFHTELRGVEEVLHDPRIAAINIPELINRREGRGQPHYSPATIPPEEYALMIEEYKEPIVNMITPRLPRDELLRRARRVLHDYKIPNLVLVGKERQEDVLPGPGVVEALRLLRSEISDHIALGGICIFNRKSRAPDEASGRSRTLAEPERVLMKAEAGCEFVTSQIAFDPGSASNFLAAYQELCNKKGAKPLTVFISLATVPSPSILTLIERLDVVVPARVRKRLLGSSRMGAESLKVATEIFETIVARAEDDGLDVPLGLQVEQLGVNNDELSLELLDMIHPTAK